eukprot:6154933-Ditylum_brightwellii.AAC.1
MEEVSQHSHMSEKSPPMQPPLVNLLQYHDMTPFTDDVLQGVAPPVEGVSKATQLYLDQCRSVNGVLFPVAQPILFHEYLDEVKRLREQTTSGPSAVSPAMVKTEAADPLLSRIGWNAFNYPWCLGYAPQCYCQGLDLLIHKDPDDFRTS